MSASPGTREVAYRLFAAEFDDATLSYSESDEERAPNYVVTPTGARVNRLFVAGVLTEVETVNEDTLRARIVDPSGAFVTYAGQYQPDEQAFLDAADTPEFVALTGKARTFEPEDSDRVYTSVRPESVNAVDADTRDRWIVTAAETTLDRLAVFRSALESDLRGNELRTALEAGGAPSPLAAGIPRALDHYDTSPAYVEAIRRVAIDALELVAGDRDDVRTPEIAPEEGGRAEIGPLPETDVTVAADAATATGSRTEATTADEPETDDEGAAEPATATATPEDSETADDDASEASVSGEMGGQTESERNVGSGSATESAAETDDDSEPVLGAEASPTDSADDLEGGDASDELGDFGASDELGDFDGGPDTIADDADSDATEGDSGDAEGDSVATEGTPGVSGEMYEMDEEERQEIEAEYDTDFSTGTEIDEPGEADIDVPDPEEIAEEAAESGSGTEAPGTGPADESEAKAADEPEAEPESTGEPDAESESDAEPEPEADAGDVDLESAVVDVMEDLDDGDGADRDAVVETTVERYGADPGAVRDAIQDALMSGKCYEPGEDALKAI